MCIGATLFSLCILQMIDPSGIANWSVTHVDWSEGKWHPKAYRAQDVTYELLKNITVCEKNLSLFALVDFLGATLNLLGVTWKYFNDTVLIISVPGREHTRH